MIEASTRVLVITYVWCSMAMGYCFLHQNYTIINVRAMIYWGREGLMWRMHKVWKEINLAAVFFQK